MEDDDRDRGADRETQNRPGSTEEEREERQRDSGGDRRDGGVAEGEEDDDPNAPPQSPASGASARHDTASRRDELPASGQSRGRAAASARDRRRGRRGRRSPRRRARSPSRAAAAPLATSSTSTGRPSRQPNVRHTFDAPTLPLPTVRMSGPRNARGSQYAEGQAAEDVPRRDQEGVLHGTRLGPIGLDGDAVGRDPAVDRRPSRGWRRRRRCTRRDRSGSRGSRRARRRRAQRAAWRSRSGRSSARRRRVEERPSSQS